MDDIAVPQHHRVGAHRARRHPALAVAVPVAAVIVVGVVFVWALTAFLGGGGDTEPSALATGSQPPTTQPLPSAAPSLPASPGTSEPLPSAAPSPEPSVDRTVAVNVLNSTDTAGLAAGAAESLEGAGWTIGEVGNYTQGAIPTTVLYNGPASAASAAAVAADLGLGSAQESTEVTAGTLTLVLGSDYSGG